MTFCVFTPRFVKTNEKCVYSTYTDKQTKPFQVSKPFDYDFTSHSLLADEEKSFYKEIFSQLDIL